VNTDPIPMPAIVIADGFLWTRDTEASPMLDGPGDPIEANIAKVRGRAAQVLTHIARTRAGINAVNAWFRDHLPDAEIYQGYAFPWGELFADVRNDDSYAKGYAAGAAEAKAKGKPK